LPGKRRRSSSRWTVQGHSLAHVGDEHDVHARGIDGAGDGPQGVVQQAQGDAPASQPPAKDLGAVYRVQGKRVALLGVKGVGCFFGQDVGLGVEGRQLVIEHVLDLGVGLGDDGAVGFEAGVQGSSALQLQGHEAGGANVGDDVFDR